MSQTVATQFPTRTIAKTDRVEAEGKDFGELVDSQPPLEREHAYGKKLTPLLPKLRNNSPSRKPPRPQSLAVAAQLSDGPSSSNGKKEPPPPQNDEDVPVPPVKSSIQPPTNDGQVAVAEKVSLEDSDEDAEPPPPLSHSQVYASQSLPVASYVTTATNSEYFVDINS